MLEPLAQHLLAHADDIIREWREEVRRDASQPANRHRLEGAALDDHLPSLIRMIAACLRGDRPEHVEKEGAAHGHQRRAHGYSVTELLWEMALFRRQMMIAVERDFRKEHPEVGPDVLTDARFSITDQLDRSVHASVSQYTREAEAERDEARSHLDDAAKRLEDANTQLTEAHAQKDRFFSVLSHELRTPLAAILNAVHVLKSLGPETETVATLRAIIDRQTRHLSRLVDDLLDSNRIAHGKLELRPAPIPLQDAITFAVESGHAAFDEKGVRLVLDLVEEPITVLADGTRVSQVVGNLLANALKFTPAGGSVTASLRVCNGDAVVAVSDTGAGIAPELLPHVFEPFEQGDTSLARSSGGLGLGLMIARGLVEMHRGTIEAHSPGVGRGATFVVRLPLYRGEPASAAAGATTEAPARSP